MGKLDTNILIHSNHRVRGINSVQCLVVRDSVGVHFHPILEILNASFRGVVVYAAGNAAFVNAVIEAQFNQPFLLRSHVFPAVPGFQFCSRRERIPRIRAAGVLTAADI